jgi:hypothetical protein
VDLAAVKRQLRQFTEERRNAPRGEVTAEFQELMGYLQAQADYLGLDALREIEQQLRAAEHHTGK